MDALRRSLILLLAAAFCAAPSLAEGLYDRPVLRIDPGHHTASLRRVDVDGDERFAVTGALDKTVRIWSVEDGRLLRTIHVPAGSGDVGKIYAVAISPDGALVAVGGWTRWTGNDRQDQIYLFDRESGALRQRISGLPTVVHHLAFSPDGTHLVATLGGANGMRLYRRGAEAWEEVARDSDYGDRSYGASFAADGRFATTSNDGMLRLYDAKGQKIAEAESGGARPFGIAFHPVGDRIAVGFLDSTAVRVFRAPDLSPAFDVDTAGVENGNLAIVAWSQDGRTLYAGGRYDDRGERPVLSWAEAGRGARGRLPGGQNTQRSLRPLAEGGLLAAAADPWLARIDPAGNPVWERGSPKADFRAQRSTLSLSADGMRVGFGLKVRGADPQIFDAASLTLEAGTDPTLAPPEQEALAIKDWVNRFDPTLDDTPLPLNRYEMSRSLAIHPDGARFVLGADWTLRAFDGAGTVLWQRAVPGTVWAVNISSDGRYVVAAYGDGTLRWHAMADGGEVLALFPFPDGRNWVAWTPSGHHFSTVGAERSLGWLVNRGWDQTAEFQPMSRQSGFFAPEVIRQILPVGDIDRVLERAGALAATQEEAAEAPVPLKIKANLHIFSVGISTYQDHPNLGLNYADDDAVDLAKALQAQATLFSDVKIQGPLIDEQATRRRILSGLRKLEQRMQPDREDVAVIHFSGHGEKVDGRYYLLPHDVDATTAGGIEDTGILIDEFILRVRRMAEKGKVLVLLDACHSGSVTDGAKSALPPDIEGVREALAAAGTGVVVLTSSTGREVSVERDIWENGAFTEAVLSGLSGAADGNEDGWISVLELTSHVVDKVQQITDFAQKPKPSTPGGVPFEAKLFRVVGQG